MSEPVNKPGIKTTEFWVSSLAPIVVPLIMALVNKFGFPISETAITAIVVGAITPPITYILGRIYNKKKAAEVEIAKNIGGEK